MASRALCQLHANCSARRWQLTLIGSSGPLTDGSGGGSFPPWEGPLPSPKAAYFLTIFQENLGSFQTSQAGLSFQSLTEQESFLLFVLNLPSVVGLHWRAVSSSPGKSFLCCHYFWCPSRPHTHTHTHTTLPRGPRWAGISSMFSGSSGSLLQQINTKALRHPPFICASFPSDS